MYIIDHFLKNRYCDFSGIIHFSKLIRTLEKDDPEIAHLNAQVRSHFLPPVAITTETHQTQ